MNFSHWIEQRARVDGERPAIICGNLQYSYSELAARITGLAAVFQHDFKIRQGDRVAWLGNNSPRVIEALFACARTGAILVPLNWRLAVPELVQIVKDAGAVLLIVGQDQVETAAMVAGQLSGCRVVHAYGAPQTESSAGTWPALQASTGQGTRELKDRRDAPESPVLILYTSGTTGSPKGVVLTQAALAWSARNSVCMHDMTAADHVLMVLPMFHAGGFNIHTLPALFCGATVTLHEGFEPGSVLAEIATGRPSLVGLVPAQIQAMVAHPDWGETALSHLRCITTGSTFVPDSCVDAWVERGVPALQVYGATETCAVAIHQTRANATATTGSVGYAARHCKIRLIDEHLRQVPLGEHGEILIKGANVFKQYWRNPPATEAALRDGWFHTGDIGFQRADGSYVIADRKADLIISGGENIYPAELEAILLEHPDIVEVAVIGQPDARWGEVPVAIVVTTIASRLDENAVQDLFTDRLARFKHPRRVKLVDTLPRNAMGKVEKFALRKQIGDLQES